MCCLPVHCKRAAAATCSLHRLPVHCKQAVAAACIPNPGRSQGPGKCGGWHVAPLMHAADTPSWYHAAGAAARHSSPWGRESGHVGTGSGRVGTGSGHVGMGSGHVGTGSGHGGTGSGGVGTGSGHGGMPHGARATGHGAPRGSGPPWGRLPAPSWGGWESVRGSGSERQTCEGCSCGAVTCGGGSGCAGGGSSHHHGSLHHRSHHHHHLRPCTRHHLRPCTRHRHHRAPGACSRRGACALAVRTPPRSHCRRRSSCPS